MLGKSKNTPLQDSSGKIWSPKNPKTLPGVGLMVETSHPQNMGVSENSGTPKSSILIGFSIINHPFWGTFIFGNTHMILGEIPKS